MLVFGSEIGGVMDVCEAGRWEGLNMSYDWVCSKYTTRRDKNDECERGEANLGQLGPRKQD